MCGRSGWAIRQIHACRLAPGFDRVYTPGEKEFLTEAAYRRDGISLTDVTLCDLRRATNGLGLATGIWNGLVRMAGSIVKRTSLGAVNRVGAVKESTTMDSATRQALIARYKDGYRVLTESLAQITDGELDARASSEEWTPREVLHHLADSEMTSAIRPRRLLAEERPAILGYDEREYARRLHYDRHIEGSLPAIRAARESTASILERLSEAEFQREGTLSESGRYSVEG